MALVNCNLQYVETKLAHIASAVASWLCYITTLNINKLHHLLKRRQTAFTLTSYRCDFWPICVILTGNLYITGNYGDGQQVVFSFSCCTLHQALSLVAKVRINLQYEFRHNKINKALIQKYFCKLCIIYLIKITTFCCLSHRHSFQRFPVSIHGLS